MRKPAIPKLCALLCAVVILNACKKEVSTNNPEKLNSTEKKLGGAIPDDPATVAKLPFIMSAEFSSLQSRAAKGGPKQTDSDADGIPDASDACPTQKETLNGYLDTDGCPDTAPPPTNTDTDGDGIGDSVDGCPTQAENINGYQDTDGCPDTPPVIIPPTQLPASVLLATPPVGSEGGEGSCVPFAVGYAARSIDWYYRTNATSYSYATNIFSPEFMYNLTKIGDCGSGTSIIRTLESLKNTGISTWQSMPYNGFDGCSTLPNSTQLANAANFKINTYSAVYKSDVTAIKSLLANKRPLIIMVILDESFALAGPGFIWKSYSGAGGFSHCLTICGYDDAKHAYKVMSSWGTIWGDAGYSWIDYDYLPQTGDVAAYVIDP